MVRLVKLLALGLFFQGSVFGTDWGSVHPGRRAGVPLPTHLWNRPKTEVLTSKSWSNIFRISANGLSELPIPKQDKPVVEARNEWTFRQTIATQMLRGKIENVLRTQVLEPARFFFNQQFSHQSPLVQSFESKLNQFNEIELFQSEAPIQGRTSNKSYRVKAGLDLRNSSSRIEYLDEDLEMGLYHTRTLTAITGGESLTQNLLFRVNKRWDTYKLRATFDFPIALPSYRASISHDFSATISSTLSAQAPARGTQLARRVDLRLAFSF